MRDSRSLFLAALSSAVILCASSACLQAADAPAFIAVGQSYVLVSANLVYSADSQFKVLEIAKDGWLKVTMCQNNQIMWVNTNQCPIIAPFPPQFPQ